MLNSIVGISQNEQRFPSQGFYLLKSWAPVERCDLQPPLPSDVLAAEMWAAAEVSVFAEGTLVELWSKCLHGNSSPLNVGWKYFSISRCNTNSQ